MLLWNLEFDVRITSYSRFHIDCFVGGVHGGDRRFTGFYGNPSRSERHHSWTFLSRLNDLFSLHWLVMGDFNEILFFSKKEGGSDRAYYSMTLFRETIEQASLQDLGFEGPLLTWDNGHEEIDPIKERIDCALGCDAWIDRFSEYGVSNLGFYGSDHRAVCLELKKGPH